jgi:hypothetical protein
MLIMQMNWPCGESGSIRYAPDCHIRQHVLQTQALLQLLYQQVNFLDIFYKLLIFLIK